MSIKLMTKATIIGSAVESAAGLRAAAGPVAEASSALMESQDPDILSVQLYTDFLRELSKEEPLTEERLADFLKEAEDKNILCVKGISLPDTIANTVINRATNAWNHSKQVTDQDHAERPDWDKALKAIDTTLHWVRLYESHLLGREDVPEETLSKGKKNWKTEEIKKEKKRVEDRKREAEERIVRNKQAKLKEKEARKARNKAEKEAKQKQKNKEEEEKKVETKPQKNQKKAKKAARKHQVSDEEEKKVETKPQENGMADDIDNIQEIKQDIPDSEQDFTGFDDDFGDLDEAQFEHRLKTFQKNLKNIFDTASGRAKLIPNFNTSRTIKE